MDKTDIAIIDCLKRNARERASNIGRQVNLSVSAVIERMRRLEKAGVIVRYTALIDERKLGNDVMAMMEVSLEHPRHYEPFTEMIRNNEHITACYYLTGEYDFMLKIITDSSDNLELIHRGIKSFEGVSSTKTHIVLKNVKEDRN